MSASHDGVVTASTKKQIARELTNPEKTMLRRWYMKAVEYNIAHDYAASWYKRLDDVVRVFIVGLPLLAAACSTLLNSKIVSVALSLLAAIFVAADSHLKCGEKRQEHQNASMKFRSLEMKIKKLFHFSEVKSTGATLRLIRQKYDEVLGSSPIVPTSVFKRASDDVHSHHLEVMDINFDEADGNMKSSSFSEMQLKMLLERLAMAHVNRLQCIDAANRLFTTSFYLGTTMACIACVATSLSALSFSGFGPKWLHQAGVVSNFALSVLGLVQGRGGYVETMERYHDISTRWSALGREIEEAIYSQPHYAADKLALSLEKKCSAFVDELKQMNLMSNFKHRACEEVQNELKDEEAKYRKALEGYTPLEIRDIS